MGNIAVGHVRYGTTGSDNKRNVQPILVNHYQGPHGARPQRQPDQLPASCARSWRVSGSIFHTTTDTEVIAYIIVQERLNRGSIEEAVSAAMDRLEGAYSLVISSPTQAHRRPRPPRLPSPLHGAG